MIAYPDAWHSGTDVPEYLTPGYDRATKSLEFRAGPLNLDAVQLAAESAGRPEHLARLGMTWVGSAAGSPDWGYGAVMKGRSRFANGLTLFNLPSPDPGGRAVWLRAVAETLGLLFLTARAEPTRSAVPQMIAVGFDPGNARRRPELSIRPAPFLLRVLGTRGPELAEAAAQAMNEYAPGLGLPAEFGCRLGGRDVLVPLREGDELLTAVPTVGPGYILNRSALSTVDEALVILAGFGRACDLARA